LLDKYLYVGLSFFNLILEILSQSWDLALQVSESVCTFAHLDF
jgi:hypothetical protein